MPSMPLYKLNLFDSCKIGHYLKFLVTYKTLFWRQNGFSGLVASDGSIICNSFETAGRNIQKPKKGSISVVYDACTDDGEAALVGFCVASGGNTPVMFL
jgi:monoamine oxidase